MNEAPTSRRRRGPGIVTANACTECRKKRSKCDGRTPCARCTAVKAECIYEAPVRQSKETMRAEIELLTKHHQQSERVLGAISQGYKVQETLNRLRNGDTLETIAEGMEQMASQAAGSAQNITTFPSNDSNSAFGNTLRMAESVSNNIGIGGSEAHDDFSGRQTWSPRHSSDSPHSHSTPANSVQGGYAMIWTSDIQSHQRSLDTPVSRPLVGVWSHRPMNDAEVQLSRGLGQEQVLGRYDNSPLRQRSLSGTWTEVTDDIHLVEHLMALYFCWEYPTFASLSKEHFIADFRAGIPRHCSPLLVNAMLALGCRFSDLPKSQVDPNDIAPSGDRFFEEAKRLLAADDHTSLTTIQAIGLMSIREISFGRDTESFYFAGQAIRLAVEAGLHMEVNEQERMTPQNDEEGVRAATFWGAFSLDQAWSLTAGRLPHISRTARLVAKPVIIDEVESSEWLPYTDEGVPDTISANQPSNVRSVYKCFCEISELVHQSLYALYSPGRRLTSNEVVAIYTRYLNWYSSLPEALRLGHNFTPAVLFAHMYYHFAILLLFRPFIKLQFVNSRVSPRDVCSQAAEAIITLVRSYDQLYTLSRTPSFVSCVVLSSCTVNLIRASGSSSALNSFRQGVRDLRDMSPSDGFAVNALNVLRFVAEEYGINNALGENPAMSTEEAKSLCSPSPSSLNLFCPLVIDQIPEGIRARTNSTLFAPFPRQGLPLLANDDQLERDGFSKIP